MSGYMVNTATRFFSKKRDAPANCIALLFLGPFASVMLLVIEAGTGAEAYAIENGKLFVLQVIPAAIWIPYFSRSKRVKATFVN